MLSDTHFRGIAYNERLGAGGSTILFMWGTNVHVRTTLSAALHFRLRQLSEAISL